ncbi:hypothetical protein [Paenibacillus xanthanilyticus]|uniref:Uncharacterized protein n=1 Tax=Paenibacillus xanthanilyticus TaxID=1783531 RepID=A0ABV8K2G7_9BACL
MNRNMPYAPSFHLSLLFASILMLLTLAAPLAVSALSLTESAKTALDKTAAEADTATRDKLQTGWSELVSLEHRQEQQDERIDALHYRNTNALAAVRKSIREIGQSRIAKLEQETSAKKKQYEPLFASYSAVGQQLALARQLGSKTAASLLKTQQDAMKPAVHLARLDIRAKQEALTAAKSQASKQMKQAREVLEDIDPLNTRIQAYKSAMRTPKKHLSTAWSNFTAAARKKNAAGTLAGLTATLQLSRQILEQKAQVAACEERIYAVILRAKTQIPAA